MLKSIRGIGRVWLAAGLFLFMCGSEIRALRGSALDAIASRCTGKVFHLRTDLRGAAPHAESMQAPMFDRKGWHSMAESGDVVLGAGERVEVTGLFNYAERGFFVELAREATGATKPPVRQRPRLRFRVMIETPGDAPEAQAEEGLALLRRVLNIPEIP